MDREDFRATVLSTLLILTMVCVIILIVVSVVNKKIVLETNYLEKQKIIKEMEVQEQILENEKKREELYKILRGTYK